MNVRILVVSLLLLAALAVPSAASAAPASPEPAHCPACVAVQTDPGEGFKKVSSLVKLPDFVPGLGVLYVDPKTLPVGPFLAYDRGGKLISTIYMVPMEDMQARKNFTLSVGSPAQGQKVDHVDVQFNAGHPGVANPHYHVILWYITPEEAAALK